MGAFFSMIFSSIRANAAKIAAAGGAAVTGTGAKSGILRSAISGIVGTGVGMGSISAFKWLEGTWASLTGADQAESLLALMSEAIADGSMSEDEFNAIAGPLEAFLIEEGVDSVLASTILASFRAGVSSGDCIDPKTLDVISRCCLTLRVSPAQLSALIIDLAVLHDMPKKKIDAAIDFSKRYRANTY